MLFLKMCKIIYDVFHLTHRFKWQQFANIDKFPRNGRAKVQQSGVQIEFSSYYFLTWPPLLLNLTTTATKIKSFTDKKGPSGVKENAPRVLRHLRHEIWCISAKKEYLFNEVGQAHCSCGKIWVVDTFFALIQGNAIQVWCIFKGHHFEWWDFFTFEILINIFKWRASIKIMCKLS